jgi:predicted MFS family arabinose efflux permease
VDTERRRRVVDDFPQPIGFDGRFNPNGCESANVSSLTSGRSARRRNRPAQAASLYTNLDAGGGDGSCGHDVARVNESDRPVAADFFLGLGAALNGPAWEAIVPELVPKAELSAAVSLSSVAFNIARAVGPAIGGVLIAASGPAATFAVNAASFVAVLFVLYRWKSAEPKSALPAERFWGAMKAGVRYLRHSPSLRAVMVRSAVFVFFGSALWALLPLRTRNELHMGAAGYGALLGCLGAGALISAWVLPKFRDKLSNDFLTSGASVAFGAATAGLALLNSFPLLCIAMLLGGFAWLAILSTFNEAAMVSGPEWVRSRALGVYMLIFHGGLALGSAAWGQLANRASLGTALLIAAAGLAVGIVVSVRYSLNHVEKANLEPSMHWPNQSLSIRSIMSMAPWPSPSSIGLILRGG